MRCEDCALCAKKPWHGFSNGCRGCVARSVARSPEYAIARREGRQTAAYRALLQRLGVTHEEARAAAKGDLIASRSVLGAML